MGAHSMYALVVSAALVVTLAGKSAAEIIYLKDGNAVEGTIVGMSADGIEVRLAGGKTTINKDAIARIDYAQAAASLPERTSARGATFEKGERLLLVGLGGGIPLKAQGFSRQAKADLAASVEAIWQLDPRWGIGISVDAPGFATNYPSDSNFDRKSEVQAAGMEAVARYVALDGRVSPIAEVGAGFDSYYQLQEQTNKATGQLTESHQITGGLAAFAGTGVQFLFGRRSLAQLGARWMYLQADKTKFPVGDAQAVEIVASYGLRF